MMYDIIIRQIIKKDCYKVVSSGFFNKLKQELKEQEMLVEMKYNSLNEEEKEVLLKTEKRRLKVEFIGIAIFFFIISILFLVGRFCFSDGDAFGESMLTLFSGVFFALSMFSLMGMLFELKKGNEKIIKQRLKWEFLQKNKDKNSNNYYVDAKCFLDVDITSRKQLQRLKEMLDEGLITQEDYDNKKKQILGL